ncbi:hypothetical protein E8E14_001206 [Neopestalotiopsis sp. 37M]|nr:hypothetical protein E8E14_001206 [Neopestalotiopsis sp. 37M]
MPYDEVARDGFECAFGRFYALPGRVERVEGSHLRSMFLPKLRPGQGTSYDFVRGQLKHYGVQYEEEEFSGNGTLLMKKVLQAGKCDKVPEHIITLQKQMHAEWLDKLTPEELSGHPNWVMEKFFLSNGEPDPTKASTVVGIPLPQFSSYRAGELREAASKVPGLHQATGSGPNTQTIFLGWDQRAVTKAASGHAATEAKKVQDAKEERDTERSEMHSDYLRSLKKNQKASPVGSYIIDCEEIEKEWPDQADDLNLDIRPTEGPDVFEADFEFGVLEGVMVISLKENAILDYCAKLDREADKEYYWDHEEDDNDNDDDEDDDEQDDDDDELGYREKPTTGTKRGAVAPKGRGQPSKKVKTASAQCLTYMLRSRCRETGEGMIYFQDEPGTITFKGGNLASFTAVAALPCVGRHVKFTGRKISGVAAHSGSSWNDYSEHHIRPFVTPTIPPLLHQETDEGIPAEFCRFNHFSRKSSAKSLRRKYEKLLLPERSKLQIFQTTTIPEERLSAGGDEIDDPSIHDDFGRQTIARWKRSGGKSKEWRKRPWQSRSFVPPSAPESFLKQFLAPKNPRWTDASRSSKARLENSWLKSATTEALACSSDDYDHQSDADNNAAWPPGQSDGSAHESVYGRAPVKQDKSGMSGDNTSVDLPNEAYSGAIIGDRFQLGVLIKEHKSPGERTYAVNDLRAPENRLLARMYSLAELSGKCRDARKRHMKRLIRRENVCDIRQDGKRFIVYPWNTSPFPLGARQHTAQNQAQQGTRRPESFKGFHNVTEFPSLSSKQPPARSKIFWETSEVQRLFQTPRKQSLPAVGTITPPTTLNDPESPVSGPASIPKRKRHRWKKARKKDQLKDYEATEPEELEVLSKTVNPSFSSRTEINKYLELKWESIMDMAAEIDGLDLHEVEMSLWNYFGDPSIQRTVAIEMLAGRERWFIDQLDYVRTVMSIMSQHFHVQDRRKEIDHLAEKEERLRGQQKQIAFSEHKLRVRLMKSKEGKKKERVKDFYEDICRELNIIEVALEDTVQKQEAILAGGDHSCG